ncbi:hypothetical protein HanRHA438_Chr06g0258151 [Helianthus annuus]|nr:hypothetical protein HanRHA438_Chr06g0258151 [Helianthus annuus]
MIEECLRAPEMIRMQVLRCVSFVHNTLPFIVKNWHRIITTQPTRDHGCSAGGPGC